MKSLGDLIRQNPADTRSLTASETSRAKTIALPWFKCDAEHMLAHIGLKECSLETKGLYFLLLCLMHKGHPYGHLARSGKSLTVNQVANGVGCRLRQVQKGLAELCNCEVLSQRADGMIYSPYLVETYEQIARAQEYGRRGGNPNLKRREMGRVNTAFNGGLNGGRSGSLKQEQD